MDPSSSSSDSFAHCRALLCLRPEGRRDTVTDGPSGGEDAGHSGLDDPVTRARVVAAGDFLEEIAVLDAARNDVRRRTAVAIKASPSTVTDVYGIGPLMAAIIIGRTGDVRRVPTAGHHARHNGTAPIEASSGPNTRHWLTPRGDRQLNHAMHIAAVTQIRHDTPGARTSSASAPRARAAKKQCAPSSDRSATPSTNASSPTPPAPTDPLTSRSSSPPE
jgi:transposase